MRETQNSITEWADETFGYATNYRLAKRAAEEMEELLAKLEENDFHEGARLEVADIVICIAKLATKLGFDIGAAVDEKMKINRARQWAKDDTGCGYHVPEEGE